MDIAKADFIEGMAKGLAVLESFDTERQRLNATLAAQRAGLTRAAARRHLLTLAHLGIWRPTAVISGWRPRCCGFPAATWRRRACRGCCSPR
jgi:predicted ArsR family transcriptional regulator